MTIKAAFDLLLDQYEEDLDLCGQYSEHWILGYVYTRVMRKRSAEHRTYDIEELEEVKLPYKDVQSFFQEKWRVSGDKAGSGNTTNIGSIRGTIDDFRSGNGPFKSEGEFLDYWRNYGRTANDRIAKFNDIHGYRCWRR